MLVTSHGSRPSTRGVMTSAPLSANPRFGQAAKSAATTRDNGWMTNATPRDWLKGKGWRADGLLSASAVAARNSVARAGMPASGGYGDDGGDGRRGGDMRPNTAPATAAKAALYSSMRGALALQQSGGGGGGGGGHEQSSGRRRRRVRRHRDGTTSVVVASSGGGGGGGAGAASDVPSPVSVGTTEAFIPPAFASLQRPKTRHDAALRTTALDGRSRSGEGLGGERAGQGQGQQGQGQGQGFVAARAPPVRQRQRQRAPVTAARQPAVPSSSSSGGSDDGSDSERENNGGDASSSRDAASGRGSRRGPRYLLQSAQVRFRRVRQQLQLSAAAGGTARSVLATGDI